MREGIIASLDGYRGQKRWCMCVWCWKVNTFLYVSTGRLIVYLLRFIKLIVFFGFPSIHPTTLLAWAFFFQSLCVFQLFSRDDSSLFINYSILP